VSIRNDALKWFRINIGTTSVKIYSSKFYSVDEAWPRQNSWWFEIPLQWLEQNANSDLHLLCQKVPNGKDFYHLKIPAEYFLRHLKELTIQKSGRVSIFPSAEANKLFKDLRGRSNISFASFLIVP
jgi:hypothetical protein